MQNSCLLKFLIGIFPVFLCPRTMGSKVRRWEEVDLPANFFFYCCQPSAEVEGILMTWLFNQK